MSNKLASFKFPVLTFLGALLLLLFFYQDVLLHPNDYIFSSHGDGIKNYYTCIYHAKYDTSFADFSGMHYPFGEHIIYTDAQPLLSWIIGQFGMADYTIGIVNLLMLLSYPISAVVLFLILIHYKVDKWWALSAAIIITFLSPQVYRMTGHFSMAYVFAVPMMWLLLIKSSQNRKIFWSVITGVYLTAFFFTHPYLAIILAFFSVFYGLFRIILLKKEIGLTILTIVIQTILPFIVLQTFIALTDHHLNRLSNPAGFFSYYASWKSVLIAHNGPLSSLYGWMKIDIGNWESWSYIGFGTIVAVIIILWDLFKRRKTFEFKKFFKSELMLFFLAAYVILIFSFCFPLKYFWLRWITDFFGPLKQFRILGRFTWVFFYVINVVAVVGLYRLFLRNRSKKIRLVFILGLIFQFAEFFTPHRVNHQIITSKNNAFIKENLDAELLELIDFVEKEKYDALIFLPFHHMSSESLMILGEEPTNYDAFMVSYHAGVPLINSNSSRMSLSEAAIVQSLFANEYVDKEFIDHLPKDAKIGVVKTRAVLDESELKMIWTFDLSMQNDKYDVFEFDRDKWNSSIYYDEIIKQEEKSNIKMKDGWYSDSTFDFIYENFDEVNTEPSPYSLGNGDAYSDLNHSWKDIYTLDSSKLAYGDYTLRIWYNYAYSLPIEMHIASKSFTSDLDLDLLNKFDIRQSKNIVGDWCLIEMDFSFTPEMKDVILINSSNVDNKSFLVDELLIYPRGAPPLFRKAEHDGMSYLIYNNHWLKSDSFSE